MNDLEKFKIISHDIMPAIESIRESLNKNGISSTLSITIDAEGYLNAHLFGTDNISLKSCPSEEKPYVEKREVFEVE